MTAQCLVYVFFLCSETTHIPNHKILRYPFKFFTKFMGNTENICNFVMVYVADVLFFISCNPMTYK